MAKLEFTQSGSPILILTQDECKKIVEANSHTYIDRLEEPGISWFGIYKQIELCANITVIPYEEDK